MKKIIHLLLLCFVAVTMFISCNDDSNNNGEKPPVDTTAKPKLGYIDLAHWYDIMHKDIETVKPLIRGTYVKDSISGKVKILIYTHETDCGTFRTEYSFISDNTLGRIYSFIYSELDSTALKTPAEVLKHGKIISDEMNTFTQSFNDGQSLLDRGRFIDHGFSMYKNNVPKLFPDDTHTYDQTKYKFLWDYLDKIIKKGLADDESLHCSQMWTIRDEDDTPDGATPEIIASVMLESLAERDTVLSGRYICVQFQYMPGVSDENNLTTPNI